MKMESRITIFKNEKVRKILHQNEWWFSIADICGVLTENTDAQAYWGELKQKLLDEGCRVSEICRRLELEAGDGSKHFND